MTDSGSPTNDHAAGPSLDKGEESSSIPPKVKRRLKNSTIDSCKLCLYSRDESPRSPTNDKRFSASRSSSTECSLKKKTKKSSQKRRQVGRETRSSTGSITTTPQLPDPRNFAVRQSPARRAKRLCLNRLRDQLSGHHQWSPRARKKRRKRSRSPRKRPSSILDGSFVPQPTRDTAVAGSSSSRGNGNDLPEAVLPNPGQEDTGPLCRIAEVRTDREMSDSHSDSEEEVLITCEAFPKNPAVEKSWQKMADILQGETSKFYRVAGCVNRVLKGSINEAQQHLQQPTTPVIGIPVVVKTEPQDGNVLQNESASTSALAAGDSAAVMPSTSASVNGVGGAMTEQPVAISSDTEAHRKQLDGGLTTGNPAAGDAARNVPESRPQAGNAVAGGQSSCQPVNESVNTPIPGSGTDEEQPLCNGTGTSVVRRDASLGTLSAEPGCSTDKAKRPSKGIGGGGPPNSFRGGRVEPLLVRRKSGDRTWSVERTGDGNRSSQGMSVTGGGQGRTSLENRNVRRNATLSSAADTNPMRGRIPAGHSGATPTSTNSNPVASNYSVDQLQNGPTVGNRHASANISQSVIPLNGPTQATDSVPFSLQLNETALPIVADSTLFVLCQRKNDSGYPTTMVLNGGAAVGARPAAQDERALHHSGGQVSIYTRATVVDGQFQSNQQRSAPPQGNHEGNTLQMIHQNSSSGCLNPGSSVPPLPPFPDRSTGAMFGNMNVATGILYPPQFPLPQAVEASFLPYPMAQYSAMYQFPYQFPAQQVNNVAYPTFGPNSSSSSTANGSFGGPGGHSPSGCVRQFFVPHFNGDPAASGIAYSNNNNPPAANQAAQQQSSSGDPDNALPPPSPLPSHS